MEIGALAFLVGWVAATLRVATPLLLATIGEVYSERSGVLNLGIEGVMFLGAFVGFAVAAQVESTGGSAYLWVGFLAAVIAGVLMGLLMAVLVVHLGLNQHVSGLGITLLCSGLALFGFRWVFGERAVLPRITPFAPLNPLPDVPVIGPILNQHWLTYAAFLVVAPLAAWTLYRTRFGLRLRAVGENPEAADAAGISVFRMRTIAVTLGSALMAAGGAFLSLAQLGAFTPGIIAGRGWVCIALVIFARWDPARAVLGAVLFGGIFALQLRLQAQGVQLPYELLLALPYIATIVALAVAGRNAPYPGAYLKPYHRE